MSMLPRCTCDPWQAILGNFHPLCNRHYASPRSAPSPQSPCVCPEPCIWCAMQEVKAQRLNTTPVVDQKTPNLTDNAAELKPCPFCGGRASLFPSSDHSTAWEGGCGNEQCSVSPQVWERTEAEAVAVWNRRPV